MSTSQPRNDLHPPCIARNIGANVTGKLHESVDVGGLAPPGINHMPCALLSTAGATTFKDEQGTTTTFTFPTSTFVPVSLAELTGANPAITFFWQPEP